MNLRTRLAKLEKTHLVDANAAMSLLAPRLSQAEIDEILDSHQDAITRAVDREMRELLKLDESVDLSAMAFTAEQQLTIEKWIDDQKSLVATIDASRARLQPRSDNRNWRGR